MVLVLIGPMGCGKTTIGKLLAARLGWSFIDGDDFHPAENIRKMQAGIALDDDDRQGWLTVLRERIKVSRVAGEGLIVACSALKKKYRDILGINQKQVVSVYLQGDLDLLRQRIEDRDHQFMHKGLLTSQLATMEEPADGLTVDIGHPPESLVDTIAQWLQHHQEEGE